MNIAAMINQFLKSLWWMHVALGHVIVIILGIVDLLDIGEASKSKNQAHQIRKDMPYRLGRLPNVRDRFLSSF